MVKKILLTILGLVAVVILGVLGLAATKPNTFRVERSATIAAPPAAVFAVVNDFNRWSEWSPWADLDPNMTKRIDGSGIGTGASYYWKGNDKVGEGRMTITESVPDTRVGMKLEFLAPWVQTNDVEIVLEAIAEGTKTSWAMTGHCDFMTKVMTVFVSMDQMMGKDFEKGLANLARVAESIPVAPDTTTAAPMGGSGT
jgi:uncharacterized protein YndB with AHSA1/START domain